MSACVWSMKRWGRKACSSVSTDGLGAPASNRCVRSWFTISSSDRARRSRSRRRCARSTAGRPGGSMLSRSQPLPLTNSASTWSPTSVVTMPFREVFPPPCITRSGSRPMRRDVYTRNDISSPHRGASRSTNSAASRSDHRLSMTARTLGVLARRFQAALGIGHEPPGRRRSSRHSRASRALLPDHRFQPLGPVRVALHARLRRRFRRADGRARGARGREAARGHDRRHRADDAPSRHQRDDRARGGRLGGDLVLRPGADRARSDEPHAHDRTLRGRGGQARRPLAHQAPARGDRDRALTAQLDLRSAAPIWASAIVAGAQADLGSLLPVWSALPFAGILLSIALCPLLVPQFWHHHFGKVAAGWALVFAVPIVLRYGGAAIHELLHVSLIDYVPFLVLIATLFTIGGGIHVAGTLRGTPLVNATLLVIGTVLASLVGTTGAAMVMIRPVLKANRHRHHRAHTVVFFIFLVANIGGGLTPLGDPPLFLGFLHGVPFFWTLGLWKQVCFAGVVVLATYVLHDWWYWSREPAHVRHPAGEPAEPIRIEGAVNVILQIGRASCRERV